MTGYIDIETTKWGDVSNLRLLPLHEGRSDFGPDMSDQDVAWYAEAHGTLVHAAPPFDLEELVTDLRDISANLTSGNETVAIDDLHDLIEKLEEQQ